MSLPVVKPAQEIERLLIQGDLSGLTEPQRLQYVKAVCDSTGLNMLTKPFEFIKLNGKLVLYATRAATDQLRKIHRVSVKISNREKLGDLYVVTATAVGADGREDESIGAVNTKGLSGESLANAMMKAETKAKRRVSLSICGLGMLDESEIDGAKYIQGEEKAKQVQAILDTPKDPVLAPESVVEETDSSIADFEIIFGKWRGKKLSDIDLHELEDYVRYLENSGSQHENVKDFVRAAHIYLERA